jgi:hypothetical protein
MKVLLLFLLFQCDVSTAQIGNATESEQDVFTSDLENALPPKAKIRRFSAYGRKSIEILIGGGGSLLVQKSATGLNQAKLGNIDARVLRGGPDGKYVFGAETSVWIPDGESSTWFARGWYRSSKEEDFVNSNVNGNFRTEISVSGIPGLVVGSVGLGVEISAEVDGFTGDRFNFAVSFDPASISHINIRELWNVVAREDIRFTDRVDPKNFEAFVGWSPGMSLSLELNRDGKVSQSLVSKIHYVLLPDDSGDSPGGATVIENSFKVRARIFGDHISGYISAAHILILPDSSTGIGQNTEVYPADSTYDDSNPNADQAWLLHQPTLNRFFHWGWNSNSN